MGVIRVLPLEVVNRIAAGEIVERPASIVKELVENSIDASATEIFIDLEDGGRQLILARDNGSGIAAEDLPLLFESHATSKLSDELIEENLFGISTLGFRGEALASIAAVAMVEVITRTCGAGHALRYRPGDKEPRPAAGEAGTVIEVRSLFYNIPARRKFLKSASTELSQAVDQLTRIALGFPGIHFRLTHARKPVLDLPPVGGLLERVGQILGRGSAEGLLEIAGGSSDSALASIEGFAGNPRVHRKDSRGQHFFVNGRWVRDRALAHALRSAYQGFQIPGKHPVAYLFLDLPAGDVDVNVHPTKTEVRFRDAQNVYRLVFSAVRKALEAGRASEPLPAAGALAFAPASAAAKPGSFQSELSVESAVLEFLQKARQDDRIHPQASPRFDREPRAEPAGFPDLAPADPLSRLRSRPAGSREAIQVLQAFLLMEAPGGLVLIDQHAFHEKILFEEIHRRLLEGVVESQRLLVPDVVDLPADLMPLIDRAEALVRPFGFELAPFGPDSVAVHAFPALFDRETGRTDIGALVRAVLESLRDDQELQDASAAPGPVREATRRLAAMLACKRAVKAGMALHPEEISDLLERGDLAEDPRHCPHGRPTAIFISRRDLEKQFDRK